MNDDWPDPLCEDESTFKTTGDLRAARRFKLVTMLGGICTKCSTRFNLRFIPHEPIPFTINETTLTRRKLDELYDVAKKCYLLCRSCAKTAKESGFPHGTPYRYTHMQCRCTDCTYARSLYMRGEIDHSDVVKAPQTQDA